MKTPEVAADLRIEELPPRRRALFEAILRERRAARPDHPSIPRRQETGPCPLSFAQERLWFLHQLDPSRPVYNIPSVLDLRGRLDVGALAAALGEIVRRHEALRVTVTARDGVPRQAGGPPPLPALPVVDLAALADAERECWSLARREAVRAFDLERGPLFRRALLRLGAERHWLVFVTHHIISDGWSIGLLIRELATLYGAFAAGRPSPLPELRIQYTDFAVWQTGWLEGGVLQRQTAYWKERLGGSSQVLALPTDRPRPAVQTLQGATLAFRLPPPLSAALRDLGRRGNATLFMTLLTGFLALLHRYTGQTDISVGSPVANRRRVETEGLIGFFVNTLVLRAELPDEPGFADFLDRMRQVALEAFDHQDLPFEMLVEVLRPQRDISHTPLFQTMFVLQNAPRPDNLFAGLAVRPVEVETGTSQFDLTLLTAEEPDGGIAATFEYNADLFESSTLQRMACHLEILLGSAAAGAGRRLADLDLLAPGERHQLLSEWNDSGEDHPRNLTIQRLFEEQAERSPQAEAVAAGGRSLSYAELNRWANRLARELRALGVGPGDRVAICLEPGLDLPVAALGTLKAGAAYVPLDPAYPPDRLSYMIADSGACALVTRESLAERLPSGLARVVLLGCCGGAEASEADGGNPPAHAGAADLPVYLMYTSGSTDRPKAVIVGQRSLVHHCLVIRRRYALGAGDRVLQFVSFSFDVAAQEIFPTLVSGATLVMRPGEGPLALGDLLRFAEEERLSVLNLPTSYWHEWVLSLSGGSVPSSLRVLIVGTEPALPERWREWLRQVGGRVRLINGYGPTETTIEATWYEPRQRDELSGLRVVPIGRPFPGFRLCVLDRRGNPQPAGVPGELCIAGEGLAWGYHGRPDLTAERFVPDPFSGVPGARLYHTGDLAAHRRDGELECLGRVDQQVKVRGFRVELGEVEAALGEHPDVSEVAVVAVEEQPGDRRLVAWLVPAAGPAPTAGELRAFLRERLPEYMVPSAFAFASSLPLNANGKIDRRALQRSHQRASGEAGEPRVPPRNELERTIAGIWREVLGRGEVGVNDNFFDVGGHSLLMMRVQARLKAVLGVEVPLLDMFRHASVGALARLLRQDGAEAEALPFQRRYGRAEQRAAALARGQQFRREQRRAPAGEEAVP